MTRCIAGFVAGLSFSVLGCSGAEEPPRVELPVVVNSDGMAPVETDLGYRVELSEARLVIDDVEFTIAGEAHEASLLQLVLDWVVPVAHAHPGHYEGGDITGVLEGHFVLDLLASNAPALGMATMIVGPYQAANFTFGRAGDVDGLAADDALLGHTAVLAGEVSRGGRSARFSLVLDSPPGRQLVGAPFAADVTEASQFEVGFELMTLDPLEGDTLFDGIDFDALPRSGEGTEAEIALRPDSTEPAVVGAYQILLRTFQTHDHFVFSAAAAQ
jgi:hypothetical protein